MRPPNVSIFFFGLAISGPTGRAGQAASAAASAPASPVAVESPAEPRKEIWVTIYDQRIEAPDHLPAGRAIFEISNASSVSWKVRVENGDRSTPVDLLIPPQKSTTVEVYLVEGRATIIAEAGTRRLETTISISKAPAPTSGSPQHAERGGAEDTNPRQRPGS